MIFNTYRFQPDEIFEVDMHFAWQLIKEKYMMRSEYTTY
jgi:hypothetical protein